MQVEVKQTALRAHPRGSDGCCSEVFKLSGYTWWAKQNAC